MRTLILAIAIALFSALAGAQSAQTSFTLNLGPLANCPAVSTIQAGQVGICAVANDTRFTPAYNGLEQALSGGAYQPIQVASSAPAGPPPVLSVNGKTPDNTGNVQLSLSVTVPAVTIPVPATTASVPASNITVPAVTVPAQ